MNFPEIDANYVNDWIASIDSMIFRRILSGKEKPILQNESVRNERGAMSSQTSTTRKRPGL